jgi:hypothetical protein
MVSSISKIAIEYAQLARITVYVCCEKEVGGGGNGEIWQNPQQGIAGISLDGDA